MLGHNYYHQTTRRYVALFGTLFNDIVITRKDSAGAAATRFKVPIAYGPTQKFLSKVDEDPDHTAPAITLPRMSFEMLGMIYDGERKLTRQQTNKIALPTNDNSFRTQFTSAPYNIEFQLNIMTKYPEDGNKIFEQIAPFFKPDWTASVEIIPELDDFAIDVPIILNSVSTEDTYEGAYEDRRILIWTLNFTLKGQYFGPVAERKVIKFVDVDVYGTMDSTVALEAVKTQPGLTANGEPTTDINETIPYQDINFDDDWDFIVTVEDADNG